MNFEIRNLTKISADRKFLKRTARIILGGEKNKRSEIYLVLVDSKKIKALNKKYLRKNRPTDVLAFPEPKNFPAASKNFNLGEIVICPQQVKKNAKKYNLSFKKELTRVLIHGILHLLGYDHQASKRKAQAMEKKENYYLLRV